MNSRGPVGSYFHSSCPAPPGPGAVAPAQLRSFLRYGSGLSLIEAARFASSLSMFDFVNVGSSLCARGAGRSC